MSEIDYNLWLVVKSNPFIGWKYIIDQLSIKLWHLQESCSWVISIALKLFVSGANSSINETILSASIYDRKHLKCSSSLTVYGFIAVAICIGILIVFWLWKISIPLGFSRLSLTAAATERTKMKRQQRTMVRVISEH
jgi:hypothetical protein